MNKFFLSIWERVHCPIPGAWFMYWLSRQSSVCSNFLNRILVGFDFLGQILVCSGFLDPTINCSTLFDPVQICFDFNGRNSIFFVCSPRRDIFRHSRPSIDMFRLSQLSQPTLLKIWRHVCSTPHKYVSTFLTKNWLLISVSRVWKCQFSSFSLKIFTYCEKIKNTSTFGNIFTLIVSIFSLRIIYVAWTILFTLFIQEKINYDAKLSADDENWRFQTRKKLKGASN